MGSFTASTLNGVTPVIANAGAKSKVMIIKSCWRDYITVGEAGGTRLSGCLVGNQSGGAEVAQDKENRKAQRSSKFVIIPAISRPSPF